MQCVLALIALYVGLAHSFTWDFFTLTRGKDIDFYTNGSKTHSEHIESANINYFTYDIVNHRLFFSEAKHKYTAIFSYNMTSKEIKSVVPTGSDTEYIYGIAFDPVKEIIFWIETSKWSIYWFSLKPGFENNVYGNLLIKLPYVALESLTVDSCRGYLYWTSSDMSNFKEPFTLQRIRFDGSEHEVIAKTELEWPYRMAIDQQTQRLYWVVGTQASNFLPTVNKLFLIESSDLNGNDRKIFYTESKVDQPMSLAISKDFVYWVHWKQRTIKLLPKNATIHDKPREIAIDQIDAVIIPNYNIEDQIQGVQDCVELKSLLPNTIVSNEYNARNVSTNMSLVHDSKVPGVSECKCIHDTIGERCNVSVCHNYCFQGNCSVSSDGEPTCRCNVGYSGIRCEVNACHAYCLNNGVCSLNKESEPVCECTGDYEGERCDLPVCLSRLNKHFQTVSMLRDILDSENSLLSSNTVDKREKSTCSATKF